jgi:toluene monooxygenase system ferredoxin subunit
VNAASGAPIGLAEAPLESYDVEVADGVVYVAAPNALKTAGLFSGIPGRTLDRVIQIARTRILDEGTVLYRVGDPAEELYVLESGRVNCVFGTDDRTSPVDDLISKGEVFGWSALLEGRPRRLAAASCLERSSLLSLSRKQLLKVLEADPAAGFAVMRRLPGLIAQRFTASGAR